MTANPNDNSATVVCKTISLVVSFFMARSFFQASNSSEDHQTKMKTFRMERGPVKYPYPPGPCELTSWQ